MEEKSIPRNTKSLMIAFALGFDLLQMGLNLIPIVGTVMAWVLSVCAWGTMFIWFKQYGVSFTKIKNVKALGFGLLVELLPVVSALPGLTLSTLRIIAVHSGTSMLGKLNPFSKATEAAESTPEQTEVQYDNTNTEESEASERTPLRDPRSRSVSGPRGIAESHTRQNRVVDIKAQ
jgi:hypothetical protein